MEAVSVKSHFDPEDYRKHYSMLARQEAKRYDDPLVLSGLCFVFAMLFLYGGFRLNSAGMCITSFMIAVSAAAVITRTFITRRKHLAASIKNIEENLRRPKNQEYMLEFDEQGFTIEIEVHKDKFTQYSRTQYRWAFFKGYRNIEKGLYLISDSIHILFGQNEFPPGITQQFFELIRQKLPELHELSA